MRMDLKERVEALAARNEQPIPYTDEKAKVAFLEFLEEGLLPVEAQRRVNRTGRWIKSRRNPKATTYDAEFHRRYEEVMASEHQLALQGRLRELLIKEAEKGNVRAIEKLLMAYDPDFSFLRPQGFQGDINIERLQVLMPQMPTELLEQMRESILAAQQKELPVIDA